MKPQYFQTLHPNRLRPQTADPSQSTRKKKQHIKEVKIYIKRRENAERKKERRKTETVTNLSVFVFCISREFSHHSFLPSSLTNRRSALCLFICPYVSSHYLFIHSIIQPTTGYFCIVVSVLKSLKLNGRQQSVVLQAFCWMGCFESNQKEGNPPATHQQVTLTLIIIIIIILFSTWGT